MDQNQQIITWLKDAHAMEQSLENVLDRQIQDTAALPELRERLEQHRDETRRHRERVAECLETFGETPSALKTAAGGLVGMMQGLSAAMFRDEIVKSVIANYAMEHFEIACYRSLRVAANQAGFEAIAKTCEDILAEETAMAEWLEEQLPDLTRNHLQTQTTR